MDGTAQGQKKKEILTTQSTLMSILQTLKLKFVCVEIGTVSTLQIMLLSQKTLPLCAVFAFFISGPGAYK